MRGLRLKLEYDTTDYDIEGFPDGRQSFKFAFEPVKRESSHINFGIVYPLTEFLHLKLAYIKGNTLPLGISMQMDLSSREPFIKKFDGPKRDLKYSETIKKVSSKSDQNLYKASLRYLADEGFYLQHANLENKELEIVYTQSKYAEAILERSKVEHLEYLIILLLKTLKKLSYLTLMVEWVCILSKLIESHSENSIQIISIRY